MSKIVTLSCSSLTNGVENVPSFPLQLVFVCVLENSLSYAMPAVLFCCSVKISSVNIKILILIIEPYTWPFPPVFIGVICLYSAFKKATPGRTDVSAVIRQLVDISIIAKRTLEIIIIKKMKCKFR